MNIDQQIQSFLVCCTQVITNEAAHKEITQKAIAMTYAMAIISEQAGADNPDWNKINQAIIDKWGFKGWNRIKNKAWKMIVEKQRRQGND